MEATTNGNLPHTASGTSLPNAGLPALASAEKTYYGSRDRNGNCDVLVECSSAQDEKIRNVRSLPLCLELRNHSPTGFAWGYGGSGPAQLALALLFDATGDRELALHFYQEFKWQAVAGWRESWSITATEIHAFIAGQSEPDHAA